MQLCPPSAQPHVASLLILSPSGLIAFLFNVMEEVLPIFGSAAVAQGGLGLTPAQLAPSLSFGGIVLCVYALKGFPWLMRWVLLLCCGKTAFPPEGAAARMTACPLDPATPCLPILHRRVGVVRALRLGLYMAAPMALSIPACSLFGGASAPTQASLLFALGFKAVAGTSAFTACLILVNMAAPKHALGSVNGCGQSLASLVRGLGKLGHVRTVPG